MNKIKQFLLNIWNYITKYSMHIVLYTILMVSIFKKDKITLDIIIFAIWILYIIIYEELQEIKKEIKNNKQ